MKKILAMVLALAMMATMLIMPAAVAEGDKPYAGTKLTYWLRFDEKASGVFSNLAESEWYKRVNEATGIEIEFIHPALGNESAEFNLMVAGGEYPDIIETNWTAYSGGPSAAIDDDVIISLDDALKSGKLDNMKAVLDENEIINKSVKTSDGHYYAVPFLRGTTTEGNSGLFTSGFFMRKDILDELKLEVPETIDEWDTVLHAVKAAHPDMIPFATRTEWLNNIFASGFDAYWDYYVEDGVVKFGQVEDNYYNLLKKLSSWYAEGLIDPDYLTHKKAGDVRKLMAAGQVFCMYDASSGGTSNIIPPLLEAGIIKDETDIATTVPVQKEKGVPAKFAKMNGLYDASGSSVAISTQCKNVDAALYLLNWFYSEEGLMNSNWGTEGESYTMVDGLPYYTDLVLKNPNGLTIAQAQAIYARPSNGATISDKRVGQQLAVYTAQKDGATKWTVTDFGNYMYPAGAAISSDASEDFATITNNVKTYREEMEAKWITGKEELTEERWDAYQAQMEAYGLSRAISYKQAAYDAFMAN